MSGLARRRPRALWLIPALLVVHNIEEALTFERYLPIVRARVPRAIRPFVAAITMDDAYVALVLVTLVGAAVVAWAFMRPDSRPALWAALLMQAVMLLNVLSHVGVAMTLTRGYAPGVLTAVLINLPFSIYLFRRAHRERWLPDRALLALIPAALLVHGPVLAGLVLVAATIARY